MVVLLRNAVLWVSFVQMGSCGLFGMKRKEEREREKKNYSSSLKGGSPEKSYVGDAVD